MSTSLISPMRLIEEELGLMASTNNLAPELIKEALSDALAESARKQFGLPQSSEVAVKFEEIEVEGNLQMDLGVSRVWNVVEVLPYEIDERQFPKLDLFRAEVQDLFITVDELSELEMVETEEQAKSYLDKTFLEPLGPLVISRTNSKQFKSAIRVLINRLKREKVAEEHKDKIGQLFMAKVKPTTQSRRRKSRDIFLTLPSTGAEGVLPAAEMLRADTVRDNDTIEVVLKEIDRTNRSGPRLILSRASGLFVQELLKKNVPEITQDNVVEIVAVAREVNYCTKIAVRSFDERIDPVGACVGMRGSRIQAVMRSIGEERVDVISHSSDPETYIRAALGLNAAQTTCEVRIDADRKEAMVIVDTELLPRTIGNRGRNVRLANQLTGWVVNVEDQESLLKKQDEEEGQEVYQLKDALGISEKFAQLLCEHGFGLSKISDEEYFEAIQDLVEGNTAILGVSDADDLDAEEYTEELVETASAVLLKKRQLQEGTSEELDASRKTLLVLKDKVPSFTHAMATNLVVFGVNSLLDVAREGGASLATKGDMSERTANALSVAARENFTIQQILGEE